MQPYPLKQKINARRLRGMQTDAERKLWTRLRSRQFVASKFRRQHPIGPFIVDFCCIERGLVIELDGGQHATQIEPDAQRTLFLRRHGFQVLRFWDNEVLKNIDGVLEQICEGLKEPSPLPSP
jgi:very-short-patch-repair endonuclease